MSQEECDDFIWIFFTEKLSQTGQKKKKTGQI